MTIMFFFSLRKKVEGNNVGGKNVRMKISKK